VRNDSIRNNLQNHRRVHQDFSSGYPKILQRLREIVHESAPGAEEAIRYGIPTFRLNGNLVHFAAYKNHIGFYPAPSGIEAFRNELAPYIHGKGTVQFPIDRPVPYDLVRKIVKYRAKENTGGGKKK
jgi:uncharacterized protein YdhG (YjbR/CyaY superfamily)